MHYILSVCGLNRNVVSVMSHMFLTASIRWNTLCAVGVNILIALKTLPLTILIASIVALRIITTKAGNTAVWAIVVGLTVHFKLKLSPYSSKHTNELQDRRGVRVGIKVCDLNEEVVKKWIIHQLISHVFCPIPVTDPNVQLNGTLEVCINEFSLCYTICIRITHSAL